MIALVANLCDPPLLSCLPTLRQRLLKHCSSVFIERSAMAKFTGPYGEGSLGFISTNCIHLPKPRPSSQAAVTEPAAPCPCSTRIQEIWTHKHSGFMSSFTSCRVHSRGRGKRKRRGERRSWNGPWGWSEVVECNFGTWHTAFLPGREETGPTMC